MDEIHAGKNSAYEKEVRELIGRLKCSGVILIVIDGDRPGADQYEVASAFKGGFESLKKVPHFLMMLAMKYADDIKRLMTNNDGRQN